MPGLRLVQFVEVCVFLFTVWLLARRILESRLAAFVACLPVLAIRDVFEYARMVLTETLFLMLAALFL